MSVLNVRLPQSLHDELREIAGVEGVSMNQMVLLAVAEKLAARRAKNEARAGSSLRALQSRSGLGREEARAGLEAWWASRPDALPVPGDEMPSELREQLAVTQPK